ncbi:MAG: hypothetical protein KJ893_01570 [Candidatus Omnitrophica bacterium]|nr:hypothetical protein [Candidatus Omnitrophota bacterium]MBU4479135.1 hypothetical protein [Candidatus Omnitrophota bacterium]MCG2702774.1 hypothetical protein [Candidatus Omnitrophota bacterium]
MLTSINTDAYKEVFFDKDILDQLYSIIAQTKISEPIIKELQALKAIIPLTYRHILIVSALSIKISLQLKDEGYDPFTTASIGIVHDLGKSRLPAGILEKTTPLTHDEFSVIQTQRINRC